MASSPVPTWLIVMIALIVITGLLFVCAWNELRRLFVRLFSSRAPDTVDQNTPLLHQRDINSDSIINTNNDHITMEIRSSNDKSPQQQQQQSSLQQQQQQQSPFQPPQQQQQQQSNQPVSILKTSINHPQNKQFHQSNQQKNQLSKEEQLQHQKRLQARLQEYANSSIHQSTTYQSTIDHQSVRAFHEEQGEPELSYEGSTGSLSSGAFSEGDIPSEDDNDLSPNSIKPDHVISYDTTSTLLETMSALNSDVGYLSDGDVDLAAEITGFDSDDDDYDTLQPTNPESILGEEQSRKEKIKKRQHQLFLQQQYDNNKQHDKQQQQQQQQTSSSTTGPTTATTTTTSTHTTPTSTTTTLQSINEKLLSGHPRKSTTFSQVVDISPDNENIIPSRYSRNQQQQQQQHQQQHRSQYHQHNMNTGAMDDNHSIHISLNNSLNDRVVANGSIILDNPQSHNNNSSYNQQQQQQQQQQFSGNHPNPLSNHNISRYSKEHSTKLNNPKLTQHVTTNSPIIDSGLSTSGTSSKKKKVTINSQVATYSNDYGHSLGYTSFDPDANMFDDIDETYSNRTSSSKK